MEPEVRGGFAAGALVHTKEGLVPIEKLKVGDWVLSKHESGEGEREYKRVTQTFVHEDSEVNLLTIDDRKPDASAWGGFVSQYHYFVVTPEHPIWVQGKGWKEARKLKHTWPFMQVELLNATTSIVVRNTRLHVTDTENVAWSAGYNSSSAYDYKGFTINVNTLEMVDNDASMPKGTKRTKPEYNFRTTVYNIEVEDFHTYYVGKAGMWARSA